MCMYVVAGHLRRRRGAGSRRRGRSEEASFDSAGQVGELASRRCVLVVTRFLLDVPLPAIFSVYASGFTCHGFIISVRFLAHYD